MAYLIWSFRLLYATIAGRRLGRRNEGEECFFGVATAIGFVMAFHHECWCEAFLMFDGPKEEHTTKTL
jgi:hypothetical protein